MELSRRRGLAALLAAAAAAGLGAAGLRKVRAQEERFVTIGTGGVTSISYPVGGAICRLVNANRPDHGIRCAVEATAGSDYSLTAIADGTLDMAIVQSDWQYRAYHGGVAEFPLPNPDLRAVFSVHSEPVTVVARADAGIATFDDLVGKRVSVGTRGSSQRAAMATLMVALGWTMEAFRPAAEIATAEQAAALCAGEVDAVVFTVGHPSGPVQEATNDCAAVLVPVTGEAIDRLVAETPYYAKATIPGGLYAGNAGNVESFGTKATFVSAARVPDDVIYTIVAAVFGDFDDFIRLHPALAHLSKPAMVHEALSAPLHPGAVRYFEEAGLL
jgi:uncharacterized protein